METIYKNLSATNEFWPRPTYFIIIKILSPSTLYLNVTILTKIKCYHLIHKKTRLLSLLLFAFGFPVHHFPEAWQDLALSLPPLLLVERCQSSLLISTVDLVFLSQTHSLHTTMSARLQVTFISIAVLSWTKILLEPNLNKKSHNLCPGSWASRTCCRSSRSQTSQSLRSHYWWDQSLLFSGYVCPLSRTPPSQHLHLATVHDQNWRTKRKKHLFLLKPI